MGNAGTAQYDVFADEYGVHALPYERAHAQFYEEVLSFLPQRAGRALDAGCGSGSLALDLAHHVDWVVGLDISRSMIALAEKQRAQRGTDNVDFVVADLEKLPFGEETFDFVVSHAVLHHTRLNITLPGLRRLVKPGGRMVISDMVTLNPRLSASPIWHILHVLKSAPGHAVLYGFRTMWRIVSFRMRPAWIRHISSDDKLTPDSFQNIYSCCLPGCRCERHGYRMVAFWEAPG